MSRNRAATVRERWVRLPFGVTLRSLGDAARPGVKSQEPGGADARRWRALARLADCQSGAGYHPAPRSVFTTFSGPASAVGISPTVAAPIEVRT